MATGERKAGKGMQFLFGGLSGMLATCVVQPLDLVKTRMQLSGEGGGAKAHKTSFHAMANIARTEGPSSLYKGLSAGLLRQATYTTARLGMYSIINDWLVARNNGNAAIPFYQKLVAGMMAGGFGAVIGTPAEVALIRMTSDGRLPPEQRRGYKNVFDALLRICREEGAKQVLMKNLPLQDNVYTHFLARHDCDITNHHATMSSSPLTLLVSLASGFLATAVSIPVDITKTRIQTMKTINGVPEYSGVMDVLSKIVKTEGVTALWKGFTPYFLRLGPHTVLTFIALEQMNAAYNRFAM
ncbi:oxoglutarate carrier, putative [Acanthamoeba castellanii str. Neff]|uniref:Oxoglutarate carrier, putative n=1 Tax=Acanthamoeba castellanii (strain ATCC 30010 / Neff) TaxID=1257118 RepID=L8H8V6_ACACF|nr:oxoglutarate carrier, putative [Acanthamoeba castellanii str. Neff]ELR21163.1 oxoglutarate carrier, putative [Acanthamoeba castellanii str. Neff]